MGEFFAGRPKKIRPEQENGALCYLDDEVTKGSIFLFWAIFLGLPAKNSPMAPAYIRLANFDLHACVIGALAKTSPVTVSPY